MAKNKNKRDQVRGPLIFNPERNSEDLSMQKTYQTKSESEFLWHQLSGVETKEESGEKAEQPKEQIRQRKPPRSNVPFNELNMEEKIEALRALPMYMVKIIYTFVTFDKVYNGFFVSHQGESIKVKLIGRKGKIISIPLNEIKDIKITP